VIEDGVRIFHPENVRIGDDVYVGHDTVINGYYKGFVELGDGVWIGAGCFLHGAAGLRLGEHASCGPHVKIITSSHDEESLEVPIQWQTIAFAPVTLEPGSSVGVGSVVLAGVTIGRDAIVGAGSVVTRSVPSSTVVAGVPARVLRQRRG
jgi:acetyltransferase-like isoleucine patch superfamily enzyme